MEAGPTKLDEFIAEARERFARVETRLDQTATKEDLARLRVEMHQEFAGMIKWMVGTAVVLGAAAITVITFVLNYATPPRNPAPLVQAVPSAAQPPVIIQLPPYPAPAPRQ